MSDNINVPSPATPALLPARALPGVRVGISVSDSADLARLGLTPTHFKLAVRELARTVLVGGGTLAYGGHLLPGGYTEFLIGELSQYASAGGFKHDGARRDDALLVCLSNAEHRKCSLDELDKVDDQLGSQGRLDCIDLNGQWLADRTAGREAAGAPYPTDKQELAKGLTALRRYMTEHTSARVLLGGKRDGYMGGMPGVMEEALMALRAHQPLYLAGGFGGITLDMAATIDPRCEDLCPNGWKERLDAASRTGLEAIAQWVGEAGMARLDNGLSPDENLHLATTHRPPEIAALVGLGLGRWALRRT